MMPFATMMFGQSPETGSGGGSTTPATDHYYTGVTQEITVPAGKTELDFALWGGGGPGGVYSAAVYGGGGGFTTGKIAVTPGETLRLQVAQGGRNPLSSAAGGVGGWPDGGGGSRGDTLGGGGGGSTRLWRGSTLLAVAGGGGAGAGYAGHGGAGGGSSGQNGSAYYCGTGGTQTAGGVDGGGDHINKHGLQIVDETSRTGGWGGSTADITTLTGDDGGGGGGGYWGGGGGGGDGQAGGGGSGFLHADCYTASTTAGNMQTPAGTGDSRYPGGGVAYGTLATSGGVYNTNHGNDGYAHLEFN